MKLKNAVSLPFYILDLSHVTNASCVLNGSSLSKEDSKDQESIQPSTTPVPGYQMGK